MEDCMNMDQIAAPLAILLVGFILLVAGAMPRPPSHETRIPSLDVVVVRGLNI
jgi:hypothetical protein